MDKEKTEVVVEPVTVVEPVIEPDPIAEKDAEIAKLTAERDNYKTAALQRKGKLPADSELFGEDFEVFMEEKIKTALADKELARKEQEKQVEIARITKENSELRLALKNRPQQGLGSDSGTSSEVKDNVFTAAQIDALKQKAIRLKTDPDKFVERAKQNFLKNNR